ncbi:MAG: hypothetical protein GXY58_11600 [Planctomycetaceae bacterium]|nr:hypothetical protein [Planctomycetaceae bacterium]
MAGFSKIYCVGGLGGFQGADGINPIEFQIWVGNADRQWLQPHYINRRIRPLGVVKCLIPEGPDDPNALLDACIAFYPEHFRECATLPVVEKRLADTSRLDFHHGKEDIPEEWPQLRTEAWPLFRKLNIFEGRLCLVTIMEEPQWAI